MIDRSLVTVIQSVPCRSLRCLCKDILGGRAANDEGPAGAVAVALVALSFFFSDIGEDPTSNNFGMF